MHVMTVKQAFCPAEEWGNFLLTEQLAASTTESLLMRLSEQKVSFMEQYKESTTKESEKKNYTGKQHRNKSQDVASVLKEN